MGNILKTYDLDGGVFVVLNGIRITGWGEDAAIEFEMPSDLGEDSVSADGHVTFSRNNDFRLLATITVRSNALACQQLAELWQVQQVQNPILPMPFMMFDTNSGDRVSEQYAVFKKVPPPSKGKAISDAEWVLLLPNAARDMLLAAGVSI